MIVELGHRADGRARGPDGVRLVDGDRRRNPVDAVDPRLVHPVEELSCVRREGLDVAALALRVHRVEYQRGLAGAGHAGHHHELAQRKVEVERAQIVLARPSNADAVGRGSGHGPGSGRVRRERSRYHDSAGCPILHDRKMPDRPGERHDGIFFRPDAARDAVLHPLQPPCGIRRAGRAAGGRPDARAAATSGGGPT